MKKFLLGVSSLALAGVFAFSGCSCSKTGTYKFEKFEMKVGNKTKSFTCSTDDKKDATVKTMCEGVSVAGIVTTPGFEKMSYELTKDEIKFFIDGKEQGTAAKYKIEDKKFYTRATDDAEWREVGTYEKGTISMSQGTTTIYFKK